MGGKASRVRDFVHILITWESDDDVPILNLSGGPFVSYGRRRVAVPEGSKRLLVFVALHRDGLSVVMPQAPCGRLGTASVLQVT